ncbi:hypothetical protein DPMN_094653 [Dreissena polymorpha]|uniref:PHD-type domain-containing protein n=1 Tax=Dreissena polymorpha TaxID=45954 RepID=A0A9D4L6H1_DREPO|nr:hypothetical protein DPMN_094653 [Dreissena polymorpha]
MIRPDVFDESSGQACLETEQTPRPESPAAGTSSSSPVAGTSSSSPVAGTSSSTSEVPGETMEMEVAGYSYETDYGHKGKQVARKKKPVPNKGATQLTKGKGGQAKKRKQSKSKEVEPEGDDSEQCPVCGIFCRDGEDSICCDSCLRWFHRTCVHLQDDEDWEYFSSSDAVYTCPLCQ